MPTQYIKTLGALTINDGDPDKPIDIRTGGIGAITINGQSIPGGGGAGTGDVFLDGAAGVVGAPQTFKCPINIGEAAPGVQRDFTVHGQILAEGNIVSKASGTLQVQGELDLARSAPNAAAVITDGGKFEMRGLGGGAAVAELDPGSKTYTFGLNTGSGVTEGTVNVQGNVFVKNGANTVITLNGQQGGGNAGLVQAAGYTAEGAGGNYRGIQTVGGVSVTYARNDVDAIDTIVVNAGNIQEVRTGAIGARTSRHRLTYDAGNTRLQETILSDGVEKLVVTDKTVAGGGVYELMRQTQEDTHFLRTPIYTTIGNYQMDVFTRNTADTIEVSQTFTGNAELFNIGTGQVVWTGRERNGFPFTPTPYDGTSIPFGRYRLILKQRNVTGSTTCVGTAGIVNGLTISDEFLYTGINPATGEYGGLVFTDDHPVCFSFTRWSADPTTGRFPLIVGSDGHINIVRQTSPDGFRFYIKFTGWNTTTLTGNLLNPTIAFACELIRLPKIS